MGSIHRSNSGKEDHWADKWHEWKPEWQLPKKRKRVKSSPGQQSLFGDIILVDTSKSSVVSRVPRRNERRGVEKRGSMCPQPCAANVVPESGRFPAS